MATVVQQFGGGGAAGLLQEEERGAELTANPVLVHKARKSQAHATAPGERAKDRAAAGGLRRLMPDANPAPLDRNRADLLEVSRYLSREEKVDMKGAGANAAAMREDDQLALSDAVQRNAARAKRGESIVEVVQKGRVQRASIRPTDGDARAGTSRAGANLSAEGGEKEAEGEVEQTSIV